jgi:hypothetical protein
LRYNTYYAEPPPSLQTSPNIPQTTKRSSVDVVLSEIHSKKYNNIGYNVSLKREDIAAQLDKVLNAGGSVNDFVVILKGVEKRQNWIKAGGTNPKTKQYIRLNSHLEKNPKGRVYKTLHDGLGAYLAVSIKRRCIELEADSNKITDQEATSILSKIDVPDVSQTSQPISQTSSPSSQTSIIDVETLKTNDAWLRLFDKLALDEIVYWEDFPDQKILEEWTKPLDMRLQSYGNGYKKLEGYRYFLHNNKPIAVKEQFYQKTIQSLNRKMSGVQTLGDVLNANKNISNISKEHLPTLQTSSEDVH